MKLKILSLGLVLIGTFCQANELPKWVENSCKVINLNQFVDWMKDSDVLYNIRETVAKEIKLSSGQVSQDVRLYFDDSKNCKNRRMRTICTPIGLETDHPAFVVESLLDSCNSSRSIVRKFSIAVDSEGGTGSR